MFCNQAIKGAIASVEGVTGDTATPHETSFEVTGDFSAAALIEALHAAGFHAEVAVQNPRSPHRSVGRKE